MWIFKICCTHIEIQNSKTITRVMPGEYISKENEILSYKLKPLGSDQGILCIGRTMIYHIEMRNNGYVFNGCTVTKIFGDKDISVSIEDDGKAIIVKTPRYENPIFVGRF